MRHQEVPALKPGFDLDGCPAPPGYAEAFQRACRSSRLTRWADCSVADHRREHEEPMKEVYFLRHAMPECCMDCGLNMEGRSQCWGLKVNNTLLKTGPRSWDQRAEVVYMSPATRTMETAVQLFGDLQVPMVIDYDLVEEFGFHQNSACRDCVSRLLKGWGKQDLLNKYDYLQDKEHWNESYDLTNLDGGTRIRRFTEKLFKRPEKRVVVVSHHMLLETWGLGMKCMTMGETVIKAGLTNMGWSLLSERSCEGRRRRWQYGNYRREVQEEGLDESVERP